MIVGTWLICLLFFPLMGGLLALLLPQRANLFSILFVGAAFSASIITLILDVQFTIEWRWIPGIDWFITLDSFNNLLIAVVLFVSLLVQVFSTSYMDKGSWRRYFAKLSFFTFSMIGLLLADHLIFLFVFWELVGLASYLLIGFWHKRKNTPIAARTAFMINRLADAAFLAGIIVLYNQDASLRLSLLGESWGLLPSILICIGAFGKSAQLPFSGWLVKAMVGPTPVSALIHAATMVAAGVYLLVRISPVLEPEALTVIISIGTATAFYGALIAVFQQDIKRVLAYSTISQLGYMVIGVGVGASDAAAFHLITHAFFKAGLFLAAGSIIHWMHHASEGDAQDMRNMGGLAKKLPWTFRAFLICGLSLAGLPLFSGFMSKEGILLASWHWAESVGSWGYLVPDLALISAFLTAFYIGRVLLLVFYGDLRIKLEKPAMQESMSMKLPLLLLAGGSLWFLFSANPFGHVTWLMDLFPAEVVNAGNNGSVTVLFLSILLAAAGLVLAYSFFRPGSGYERNYHKMDVSGARWLGEGLFLTGLYARGGKLIEMSASQLYRLDRKVIDAFLDFFAVSIVVLSKFVSLVDRFVIDGPVNLIGSLSKGVGRALAGFSSQDLRTQLSWLLVGMLFILSWVLFFS